jgi:hypothetical protein
MDRTLKRKSRLRQSKMKTINQADENNRMGALQGWEAEHPWQRESRWHAHLGGCATTTPVPSGGTSAVVRKGLAARNAVNAAYLAVQAIPKSPFQR